MGVDHFPETTFNGDFHGEVVTDGDATTLTALTLYKSGTATTFTLGSTYRLHITDVFIMIESGGDFELVADAAAGGKYIVQGNAAANGGVVRHYEKPYVCLPGVVPKFKGVATNRNTCIIEGYITTK